MHRCDHKSYFFIHFKILFELLLQSVKKEITFYRAPYDIQGTADALAAVLSAKAVYGKVTLHGEAHATACNGRADTSGRRARLRYC
jgi:hypothetical protein